MSFLVWKYISEAQIQELEECLDEVGIKKKLMAIFGLEAVDRKKLKITLGFHFRNYAFCKEKAFDFRRTSTFMSMMNEIFIVDASLNSSVNSLELSFQRFKDLMMKHSVDRPPKSVQVFRETDLDAILFFSIERYFKNFKLYSYIFATQARTEIKQVSSNFTEVPKIALPLAEAFQLS